MNTRIQEAYWYKYLDNVSKTGAKSHEFETTPSDIFITLIQLSSTKQIQGMGKTETTHQGETRSKGIKIGDRIIVNSVKYIVTTVNEEGRLTLLGLKNEIL